MAQGSAMKTGHSFSGKVDCRKTWAFLFWKSRLPQDMYAMASSCFSDASSHVAPAAEPLVLQAPLRPPPRFTAGLRRFDMVQGQQGTLKGGFVCGHVLTTGHVGVSQSQGSFPNRLSAQLWEERLTLVGSANFYRTGSQDNRR